MTAKKGRTSPAVDDRRSTPRIAGPFDGWRLGALDTPIRIFDLSSGGCFVNAVHVQQTGQELTLEIELPHEGWIRVKALTLDKRSELGFAVRFVRMNARDAGRLERALTRLQGGTDPD